MIRYNTASGGEVVMNVVVEGCGLIDIRCLDDGFLDFGCLDYGYLDDGYLDGI